MSVTPVSRHRVSRPNSFYITRRSWNGASVVSWTAAVPFVQTGRRDETDYFAVVPQFGIKVGWHPVDHVRCARERFQAHGVVLRIE